MNGVRSGRSLRRPSCCLLWGATGASGALGSPALSVRITSAPPATAASSEATFGWVANETAKFTCALDGIPPRPAVRPRPTRPRGGRCTSSSSRRRTPIAPGRPTRRAICHRWTIDLPGGPPPPPPPPAPKTASLLVTVEGGGQVTSEPPGIGCPGDCEQSFPVGTTVTLSQKPAQVSRFAGWRGACEGAGACAPAVSDMRLWSWPHSRRTSGAAPRSRRPRG